MSWEPNAQGLQQLVHLLSETSSPSQEVQSRIYQVRKVFIFKEGCDHLFLF